VALCLSPASYRDVTAHRSARRCRCGWWMRRIARRSWLGGLRASKRLVELPVHPGRDWFTVLSGTVLVLLGERTIRVEPGQAAEFSTMVPHAFGAQGGPAEVIAILDPDGQRSHLRR